MHGERWRVCPTHSPSLSTMRSPTMGWPLMRPRPQASCSPCSMAGMKFFGMFMPIVSSTNST